MYVSRWPELSPRWFIAPASSARLPFPLDLSDGLSFYRAMNAIFHLFRTFVRPGDTVLVPDYHCGNEVLAIRAAGAAVRYYPIRRDLSPDLDTLEGLLRDGARALLAIHFMGWPQPIPEMARLSERYGAVLVEDCAVALLSTLDGRPLGTFGDFAVFCLHKSLPVPNGAVLVQNGAPVPLLEGLNLRRCDLVSVAGRCADAMIPWIQSRAGRLGVLLSRAKHGTGQILTAAGIERAGLHDGSFDLDKADLAMSGISRWLVPRFDYEAILRLRRENFQHLLDLLRGHVDLVFDRLEDGVCPLFFPILVPERAPAAAALRERGVPAGEWWATGDGVATGAAHEDAEFLRAHVLELPIHQDLTASHVEFIATEVLRLSQRTGASSWTGVESFAATSTRVSSALSPDGSDR